ncbi:CCA tRNA nucleotidyltransferase [Pelistega ratti]|uniref:CCA tRNA nucleotidyltransferase n=1 Tax=Pelistega ratti TaxID=2652177 RepID=UPI001FA9CABC|nr:CCA tRNA nucleotidyltransferase [Pelistega ratti]
MTITLSNLAFESDQYTEGLSIFCVGGAVRDALLHLPSGDKDWVVVGSTPEEMVARQFIPVGGDFPVFLHPITKEEYALARTERKSGRGYQGFTFYTGKDVSLAEDLKRRDFTINAIATDQQGNIYDPYQGVNDLNIKLFRHVSEAFVEDPVRILRLGRFLSRLSTFSVASETILLCRQMVCNGEVNALVAERVWKEISRALMEKEPQRCFTFLADIGALSVVIPLLHWDTSIGEYLVESAKRRLTLSQRYALLVWKSEQVKRLSQQLRVAKEQADYAHYLPIVYKGFSELQGIQQLPMTSDQAHQIVSFIEQVDGIRKPERLWQLIEVCTIIHQMSVVQSIAYLDFWKTVLQKVKSVEAGQIAQQYKGQVEQIKIAVREAREGVLLG